MRLNAEFSKIFGNLSYHLDSIYVFSKCVQSFMSSYLSFYRIHKSFTFYIYNNIIMLIKQLNFLISFYFASARVKFLSLLGFVKLNHCIYIICKVEFCIYICTLDNPCIPDLLLYPCIPVFLYPCIPVFLYSIYLCPCIPVSLYCIYLLSLYLCIESHVSLYPCISVLYLPVSRVLYLPIIPVSVY